MPSSAEAFDAAIIPYRLNRQVANANPLELRNIAIAMLAGAGLMWLGTRMARGDAPHRP